jgi:CubicO group peptidase (beta-lactamase class C family)
MVFGFGAATAQVTPVLPAGPAGDRVGDYVAALNDAGAPSAARFAALDMPAEPADAIQQFFESQKRLTHGITPIGFRFDDASETSGVLVFKDAIYAGLRAIQFTFDKTAARHILNFTFVAPPVWAVNTLPAQSPDEVAAYAKALIERGCQADVFSGSFLVAREGKIVFQQACGDASKRYQAPNVVTTRFNIGSMNKMFTAVTVAQLVDQRRLALNDRLSAYVDETWLPKSISDRITIGELFSMTSGLAGDFDGATTNRGLDDYKPTIHALKLVSVPGETYAYSNTDYFLLGLVIQKASGEDYYDYIRQHIYVPAGMTATDSYFLDGPEENLATGYMYASLPREWFENVTAAPLKGTPDGGGYSTAGDLFRFAEALTSGKLLPPKSLSLLFKDHRPPSGTGFFVIDSPAGRVVGKDGRGRGISAEMDIYLDADWVVVSLSNYDEGARPPIEAMRSAIAAARRP